MVSDHARLTFQEFGNARLQALCQAVGHGPADIETAQRFFTLMSSPWGTQRIGTSPPWRSDITDDCTPFEFSLALDGDTPEVRFLIEAQNGSTTLRSSWEDGLALNERLSHALDVPLHRFERVKDLFEPRDPAARYALWHAFGLRPGGRPAVKLYLNPQAHGLDASRAIIQEALQRLGLASAWQFLSRVAMRRGAQDTPIYFSLDLSGHRAARVKVYIAHQDATPDDVEAIMAQAREYVPGEAQAFYGHMVGNAGRAQAPRALQTCLAFTSDDDAHPASVTLYIPVRCFARNDRDALQRIRAVLEPSRFAMLERAVLALAGRPLEAGVGLVQWASVRREGGNRRLTFYLATEAYGAAAPR